MIKTNLFDKIFDIMTEYERLINIPKEFNQEKKSNLNPQNSNTDKNTYTNTHIDQNIKTAQKSNNLFEDDDFFKYIYNNIFIKKSHSVTNSSLNTQYDTQHDTYNDNANNNNEESNDKIRTNKVIDNVSINDKKNPINSQINDENNKQENSKQENNIKQIKEYIKKIYKKIILKCHPDKNGDVNIFIKCQEYYETNFLIGILYIAYKINCPINPLTDIIINQILIEIRIIQEKIFLLKNLC